MKLKYYILLAIYPLVLSSCDLLGKIDDIKPDYVLTDETVISDLKTAEATLNGVYSSFRNIRIGWFRNNLNFLTGVQEETNVAGSAGFKNNDINIDNVAVQNNYAAWYNVINNATSFIANLANNANIKGLSGERRIEMIGEAKFMRALSYLHLLRQFGDFCNLESEYGIVLYGEQPIRDNEAIARSSVRDSYKAINDDLDDAIDHAPESSTHYKVCRFTAKALKVRVLLYMGEDKQAADLAQEVIDESSAYGYELEENFLDIFINTFDSPEVIFGIYVSHPNETYMGLWNQFKVAATTTSIAASLGENGNKDQRYLDAFINLDPKKTYIHNNKYPYQENVDEIQNGHFYIRLAEMFYIKAEAEARLQQWDAARKALKDIICLDRAGYTSEYVDDIPNTQLLEMILKHKWMELCSEDNEELFDLVRYHIRDNFKIAPTYIKTDARLKLPIPKSALAGNILLVQNPEYIVK